MTPFTSTKTRFAASPQPKAAEIPFPHPSCTWNCSYQQLNVSLDTESKNPLRTWEFVNWLLSNPILYAIYTPAIDPFTNQWRTNPSSSSGRKDALTKPSKPFSEQPRREHSCMHATHRRRTAALCGRGRVSLFPGSLVLRLRPSTLCNTLSQYAWLWLHIPHDGSSTDSLKHAQGLAVRVC